MMIIFSIIYVQPFLQNGGEEDKAKKSIELLQKTKGKKKP